MNDERFLDRMEKGFDKLENKIDSLDDRVTLVEKQLAIYNEQLKVHIEGVKLARHQNELLGEYLEASLLSFNKKLDPVADHVNKIKNWGTVSFKIITTLTAITAFIYSLYQIGLLK